MSQNLYRAQDRKAARTLQRRTVLAAIAWGGLALSARSARGAPSATLPAPSSLQSELAAALSSNLPLVVMASLEGCPYCKVVRQSHLAPLRQEAGQPVVQLDAGSARAVRDFHGTSTTHDRLLRAWGIGVTPTVLFFGKGGSEVAQRLVGASIPDFYGAYLEERLRQARTGLG